MSAVRRVAVDGLFRGVPYSYAMTTPPGARLVVLAGACPLDAAGKVVGAGDVSAQAAACLRTMTTVLRAADARLEDVVFVRVSVASADRDELAAAWDVVHAAFGDHEPPGTLLGVAALGWPDQLVEIEAVAAVLDATPEHDLSEA